MLSQQWSAYVVANVMKVLTVLYVLYFKVMT